MTQKPQITVAVVCLNEEKNIGPCLESLLHQTFPLKNYEILVVDNGSTDDTLKVVKKFKAKSPNLRWVENSKIGIAASRNVAVKESRGELLALTDADCRTPRQWLKKLISGFDKYHRLDPLVVAVGGANRPPQTTTFNQSLSLILNTFLGSRGSVQARRYLHDRYVPHLPCVNVLFLKQKIKAVNGFDETFGSIIEDEDLTYRLSQKGYHFVYLAHTAVAHKTARNFSHWAKKMFVYGKGRIWFLKKYPEKWHLFFALPIVFVLTWPLSLWPYLIAIFFYSLGVVLKAQKTHLLPQIMLLFLATHFAYGVGEIYGFIVKRPKE